MSVAAGAAVGGGSLIYANISCEAPPPIFDQGWCPEITYQELKPHYDAVADFMDVKPVPDNQWTGRMKLMRDAAVGHRFRRPVPEARPRRLVRPQLDLRRRLTPRASWARPPSQTSMAHPKEPASTSATAISAATCSPRTRSIETTSTWPRIKCHAEIRPLHLVDRIEPLPDGTYQVSFDSI